MAATVTHGRFVLRLEGTGALKGKDKRSMCVSSTCTPASVRNRIVQGFGLHPNSNIEVYDSFQDGEDTTLLDMDLDGVVHSIVEHLNNGTPTLLSSNTMLVDCKSQIVKEVFNVNSPNENVTPVLVDITAPPKKTRNRKEWVEKMDGLWPIHIWRYGEWHAIGSVHNIPTDPIPPHTEPVKTMTTTSHVGLAQ